MSHPYQNVRQSKVEHSRAGTMTQAYASGGGVHSDVVADKKLIKKTVKPSALRMDGGRVNARQDRPSRASGGRVKKGNTTVNVIVAPQGGGEKPDMPMPPPPMPPMAMAPPPMPRPGPPMPPPGVGGPPMPPGPIRSMGGRAYASGGAVKPGPAYEEGKSEGTQVSHDPGKNDLKDMNRGRVITYKTGGAVEAPRGRKGMGPKLPGGGRGGLARLAKASRARGRRD